MFYGTKLASDQHQYTIHFDKVGQAVCHIDECHIRVGASQRLQDTP